MVRGKLFVIEGIDATGKATQTEELAKRIRSTGAVVSRMSFPNYDTPTGQAVRMYLEGELGGVDDVGPKFASMLYALDRKAVLDTMQNALSRGHLVIDRYVASNMAHQGAKIPQASQRDTFYQWVEDLEHGRFKLPKADLTICLELPETLAAGLLEERAKEQGKDIHEGNREYLGRVRNAYDEIASANGWARVDCSQDGKMRSIDDIATEIYGIVKTKL